MTVLRHLADLCYLVRALAANGSVEVPEASVVD